MVEIGLLLKLAEAVSTIAIEVIFFVPQKRRKSFPLKYTFSNNTGIY